MGAVSAAGGEEAGVPLARLFAMAFRSLIDALHARLKETDVADLRPAYGFVLVAARDGAPSVNDVAALMGTTKQAASKLIDGMEADGYVHRVADAADARARRIRLTPRGHAALRTVEAVYAELEAEWARVVGRERLEALRGDLTAVLRSQNGGRLPAVRPTW
ncbi:MAG TPA: MarR family winged helix-turn-helix transcriptional regulator [Longimicrobium sp.]|nr:MarR family winged helix-turn-helix transcriptional regulator [Longimicrobium sp.]